MTTPGPDLQHFALRPGRGEVVLHATGFRHPRSRRGRERFTGYADLTHLQLGRRLLRMGTRQGVYLLPRTLFADASAPEALVRALLERVVREPAGAAQLARMADADEAARRPRPLRACAAAAGLCLAAFGLERWLGPVVHHIGFMNPFLATHGESWRLVTANLLHAGPAHLALNTLGLVALGALVERPLGSARTLLVLGLSGLASTASAWLAGYDAMVGASGMVAGLAGAALWLELRRPERLPAGWRVPRRPLVAAIVLDGLAPLLVPFIAGAAHVAGFAAGAAAAALATGPHLRAPLRPPVALACGLVALLAVASMAGAGRLLVGGAAWEGHAGRLLDADATPPVLMNDAAWIIATAAEPTDDALTKAVELAERAVRATQRRDPNVLDTLAEAQFRAGDPPAALATIEDAIALAPGEPYYFEQRRRFRGERAPEDRPAPPSEPFLDPAPRPGAEPFEDPGIAI